MMRKENKCVVIDDDVVVVVVVMLHPWVCVRVQAEEWERNRWRRELRDKCGSTRRVYKRPRKRRESEQRPEPTTEKGRVGNGAVGRGSVPLKRQRSKAWQRVTAGKLWWALRLDWTHQQAPPYVHKPTTTAMSLHSHRRPPTSTLLPPLPSFPTLPSFPFLSFQFATYYCPAYFASFLTASLPCLPPLCVR
jgi:hypothetical protein